VDGADDVVRETPPEREEDAEGNSLVVNDLAAVLGDMGTAAGGGIEVTFWARLMLLKSVCSSDATDILSVSLSISMSEAS
jgi:hypothetical protein